MNMMSIKWRLFYGNYTMIACEGCLIIIKWLFDDNNGNKRCFVVDED
jgi:hypothetical protein